MANLFLKSSLFFFLSAVSVQATTIFVDTCNTSKVSLYFKFTISGNTPSMAETNRMVDVMLSEANCKTFEKIDFEPVFCPWGIGEFIPCRPYHELKFKKCQLREYKEIQNMDEESARATRLVADEVCYLEAIK